MRHGCCPWILMVISLEPERVKSVSCSLLRRSPQGAICLSTVSRWPLSLRGLSSWAACHTLLQKANSLHAKEAAVTAWITWGSLAYFYGVWRTGGRDWEWTCPWVFTLHFSPSAQVTVKLAKQPGQHFAKTHVNLCHLWNCTSDFITVMLGLVYEDALISFPRTLTVEVKHHEADLGHLAPSIMTGGDRNDVTQSTPDNLHINHRVYKADVTPSGGRHWSFSPTLGHNEICLSLSHWLVLLYGCSEEELLVLLTAWWSLSQARLKSVTQLWRLQLLPQEHWSGWWKNLQRRCFFTSTLVFHEIDRFTVTGGLLLSSFPALFWGIDIAVVQNGPAWHFPSCFLFEAVPAVWF